MIFNNDERKEGGKGGFCWQGDEKKLRLVGDFPQLIV